MSRIPTYEELEAQVTELEDKVQKLQCEAIKYQTLFSFFPHGITVSDEHGKILETNDAAEQLLGLDRKEHEKRSIKSKKWNIIRTDGSDIPPNVWPGVISLRDNRQVLNCEIGVVQSNNEVTWLNVSTAPLPLKGFGIVATYSDITDKKLSEGALRASEEKFRQLAALSPGGIYLADLNGDCVYVNETWLKMAGMLYEDAMGKGWIKGLCPDDRKKISQDWYNIVDSNDIWSNEYRFQNPPGEVTWVYGYATPIRNEDGNITEYLGINIDITERKRMEDDLRKYHNIVSSTPDGIAYLDKNYRYVIVNDAYECFSGVSREQFVGMTVAEYLGEDIFQSHVKPRFDRCLKGETVTFQEWFDYPTLGRRFVEVNYFPYRDANDQITGVVSSTRDLTDRVIAEKVILKKDKALENQAQHLQEVNTALKILLDQRESEKKALEENLYTNVQKLIFPYLKRIEQITEVELTKTYLDIIESNLNDIISPIAKNLSSIHMKLTPREVQVCNLIIQGKTSKEIASLMNVSIDAISVHRYSVRRKLGLLNTKTNLRVYLQNLTD